ncbi:hypothetical protein [Pseudomonas sp. CF161]|uniref:hypothetical protein n=1 Tax=Pseudomonas sp. CF161 TaxID=911241 RepID=UPI0003554187|nr:hypothetical protein [Pseudomonas sp. CF161]EPL03514.1 hypothetical protein CF161_31365 [Pseudomonas sp. CF161]
MSAAQYAIWFINNSSSSGNVCVYQDPANVTFNNSDALQTLAWMVMGANPGTQIQFVWSLSYDLVWFDYDSPLTQQILAAPPGNQVTLSQNQYGYMFSKPSSGTAGALVIKADATVAPVNNVICGIGLGGAGTFGVKPQPNQTGTFTPCTGALTYWISFGYNGATNDVIDPEALNLSQQITFPPGVYSMTALYNLDGTWTLQSGSPIQPASMTQTAKASPITYNPAEQALPNSVQA